MFRVATRILLDAGAHTDYIDKLGSLPGERSWNFEVQELLRANRKFSLKYRCAHLINAHKVPYVNCLPKSLVTFVKRHGTGQRKTST